MSVNADDLPVDYGKFEPHPPFKPYAEAIPIIACGPAVSKHKLANNSGGNYSKCAKHE